MSEYVCPSPEEFQFLLNGAFDQTEGGPNECLMKIQYMLSNHMLDLFGCCGNAIQQPNATEKIIYNALIILKRAFTPNASVSLTNVRSKWFSEQYSGVRNLVKYSLVLCLSHSFLPVRNQAAHCISYLLIIESDKWADLIPLLIQKLNAKTTSGNAISGIISTFIEIFATDGIFNRSIPGQNLPPQFETLINFLLFNLKNPGLTMEQYFSCAECLLLMLKRIPNFFLLKIESYFNSIIESLNISFPHADIRLYRIYHHILLQFLQNYYNLHPKFMNQMFAMLRNGLSSQFKSITIDFWYHVYKFEKDIEFEGMRFSCIHFAAKNLTKPLLNIMLNLKNPENGDYQPSDTSDWSFYCCKVLHKFIKAFLVGKLRESDILFGIVTSFINDCTHQTNPSINHIIGGILGLKAICNSINTEPLNNCLLQHFPFIIDCCHNPTPRILVNALLLLKEFIKSNYLNAGKSIFQTPIFKVIADNSSINNPYVFENNIEIAIQCAISFANDDKLNLYNDFHSIFKVLLAKEFILNSPCNGKVYLILHYYFESFIKYKIKTDSKEIQDLYFYLKNDAKVLLNQSLLDLYQSFNLMIDTSQILITSIFQLISTLIKFLGVEVGQYVDKIIDLMIKIVKHQSNYTENAFSIIIKLIYICKENINKYINDFLPMIDSCLNSRSPSLIGHSALLLGHLFKNLKSFAAPDIDTFLKKLFDLLMDPAVDNRRDYYSELINSVANIMDGVRSMYFPKEYRDIYTKKLIELSCRPIDFNNLPREEMLQMYSSVAFGFSILLDVYKEDDDFLSVFSINKNNNVIVKFLKFISMKKACNMSTIESYLNLIHNFGEAYKGKKNNYNIIINSPYIYDLINYALTSNDPEIRKKSRELSYELKHL